MARSVTQQDLLLAQIQREEAQRVAALWQKPALCDSDAAAAVGLPYSTWSLLKARKETPCMFSLGRRVFVKTEVLRAWLEERASNGGFTK